MSDQITVYEDADAGQSTHAGGQQFETKEEYEAYRERKRQMVARRNVEAQQEEAKTTNPPYLNFAAATSAEAVLKKVLQKNDKWKQPMPFVHRSRDDPGHISKMR